MKMITKIKPVIKKYNPMIGFAWNTVLKWEKVNVITSWFFTSDNNSFFTYIKTIEDIFWLRGDFLSNFLIVLKQDWVALIYYIDNFWLTINANIISPTIKWEKIYKNDIFWIESINIKLFR